MCSEKEIYNLVNLGILEVRNIDLPRKVKDLKILLIIKLIKNT